MGPLSPRSGFNSGANTPLGFTSPLSPEDMSVLENDHLEHLEHLDSLEHLESLTNGHNVTDLPVEQEEEQILS